MQNYQALTIQFTGPYKFGANNIPNEKGIYLECVKVKDEQKYRIIYVGESSTGFKITLDRHRTHLESYDEDMFELTDKGEVNITYINGYDSKDSGSKEILKTNLEKIDIFCGAIPDKYNTKHIETCIIYYLKRKQETRKYLISTEITRLPTEDFQLSKIVFEMENGSSLSINGLENGVDIPGR